MTPAPRRVTGDRGSAIAEYALVSGLLLLLAMGVFQVALVLHARNVLVADAAEGARFGANQGSSLAAGEQRCDRAVAESLSLRLVGRQFACHAAEEINVAGVRLVSMTIDAQVPFTFLPLGRAHLHVTAHVLAEP